MVINKSDLTQSKIADMVRDSLENFRDENNNFKYVNQIQNNLFTGDPIELSYDIFDDEVQDVLKNEDKVKVCGAIRDAVESSFANLYGVKQLELVRKENKIKIYLNGEKIEDLSEDSQFELWQKSIPDKTDIETPAKWMISYLIRRHNMTSKIDIEKYLTRWVRQLAATEEKDYLHLPEILTKKLCKQIINDIFSNPDVVEHTTKIAFIMGKNNESILLDQSQTHEAAHWLKGRFYLKRLGLDGRLFFFNGKCYEAKAEDMIAREARKIIFQSNKSIVTEITDHCNAIADLIEFNDILENSHLQCLKNGIYDAKTGKYQKTYNPEFLIFDQLPYSFDEKANFDRIDNIVTQIFSGNDPSIKQCFYDWLSVAFIPYAGLSFWFIMESPTGYGKSQLATLVESIIGIDRKGSANVHRLSTDATTRIDIAYKLVNIDEEMNSGDIKFINVLKKWINQEPFTDRAIHQHNENYRPRAILLSLTNELFEIASLADAEAIYRRSMLVILKNKFAETSNDYIDIMKNTLDEQQGNGLITYLLKNATKLYKERKIKTRLPSSEVENLWNKFGNNIRHFFENNFVRLEGAKMLKKDAFPLWEEYTILKNLKLGSKNSFYKKFEEIANVEPTHARDEDHPERWVYYYYGIRPMTEEEKEQHDQLKLKEFDPA